MAVAHCNGKKTWLTEDILNEIGGHSEAQPNIKLSALEIIKRQAKIFSVERIKPIFGQRRLGLNTALLWLIWILIGMGYPMFNVRSTQAQLRHHKHH